MDIERRLTLVGSECGIRMSREPKGGQRISGYAAVFGSSTDLGSFVEEIAPGAFQKALRTSDVRGLFNYDCNKVLGRLKSGTMRAKEDTRGLWYEIDVPNTTTGTEVVELIKRGDVSGNSFSFTVPPGGERWDRSGDKPKHTILEVGALYDVGPVTYPAYEGTTVTVSSRARSMATSVATEPTWVTRSRRLDAKRPPPAPMKTKPEQIREAIAKDPEWARRVAVHEAGHVVAYLLEGAGCARVGFDVERCGGLSGYAAPARGALSLEGHVAGVAGTRLLLPGPAFLSGPDLRGTERALGREGARLAHYGEDAIQRVQAALRPQRRALEVLARVILERHRLDGPEAERIALDAMTQDGRDQVRRARERVA